MLDIVCFVPCPWSMNVHKAFEDYVNLWYVENWMCLLEALWKYTPTLFFWSQTTNAKSVASNILFKTYVYQGMKICQRHTTTFHVGYIVCWCLKKEMLTMCVLIYDVGKLISSLSFSQLLKKKSWLFIMVVIYTT